MMMTGLFKTAAAAIALVPMPVAAVAATPAASLSVAEHVRAGAAMDQASEQFEGITAYVVPIAIVIVIALALYFALEDEGPVSA